MQGNNINVNRILKSLILLGLIIYVYITIISKYNFYNYLNVSSNKDILIGGSYVNVFKFSSKVFYIVLFPQQSEILLIDNIFYFYSFENNACGKNYSTAVTLNGKTFNKICLPDADSIFHNYSIIDKKVFSINSQVNTIQDIINFVGVKGAFD